MPDLSTSTIMLSAGFGLIVIGLAGVLLRRNILRIIIGFSLIDTGVAVVLVSLGYVSGGTAPIIDADLSAAQAAASVVDPVPAALTVTAIVIGFAASAVMLAYAVRLYRMHGALDIDAFRSSRG